MPLNKRLPVFICLFFLICLTATAWGRKEKTAGIANEEVPSLEESDNEDIQAEEIVIVRVSGIVRLVGTSNFPEIVITGQGKEWHIDKAEEQLLWDLQHLEVTVEGEETVFQLRFANGTPAGEQRILKNIKLLDVQ